LFRFQSVGDYRSRVKKERLKITLRRQE